MYAVVIVDFLVLLLLLIFIVIYFAEKLVAPVRVMLVMFDLKSSPHSVETLHPFKEVSWSSSSCAGTRDYNQDDEWTDGRTDG